MAIYRVHTTKDYTIMSNTHLRDKRMSLKAKGLLSVMLSLPDTWDYSMNGLCAICKENETAVKSTLNELKQFGYLIVTKKMPNETDSGRIEYIYDVFEQPKLKQAVEKQGIENLPLEFQGVENQGQLNTNQSITKKTNTDKSIKDKYISEFAVLWKLYPNKKGKDKALNYYIKARKKGVEFETVKQGILDYCKECKIKNCEKQYIKHGSTWFGNSGWNDEYDFTPNYQQKNGKTYGINGIAITDEKSELDDLF